MLDLDLGTSQTGPPISFTMDGTQYIAVTGGMAPAGGAGGGRGTPPSRTANLIVLAVDGKK